MQANDMKEMREALEVIRGMVNEELEDLKDISDEVRADFISIRGWCDHALAGPSRNCDRFADELDAQIAFLNEVWLISVTKGSMLERDKFENWTDLMKARYAGWLFAPAAEQKEENDGSR